MKYLFLICLCCLIGNGLSAQSFSRIDKRARKAPASVGKDIEMLTEYLIHDYETDLEKVRSFYSWLVHHVRYDEAAYKKGKRRINRSNKDILKRGKAVCFGYSTLFAALCEKANIPAVIVDGYPRQQGKADLKAVTHSWNAVYLEGRWHLLDITWGEWNEKLTTPENFITSHLPADPMWQLLSCPIFPEDFRKSDATIQRLALQKDTCFNYQDSIIAWQTLPLHLQGLKAARNAYQFHPIEQNKEQLGQAMLDLITKLSDQTEKLIASDSMDLALGLQSQMINLYESASQYVALYPRQKENLAYTHFNYGVALSRKLPAAENQQILLHEMLIHFEKGEKELASLPQNILLENALAQLREYITWTKEMLATFKK